jgi:ubiquinone biosynthesis UbiH/UbiF/VisC/COQ6 family hydroxylase
MFRSLRRTFSRELVKSHYDVTILGAGINGLALAWKLSAHDCFKEDSTRKILVIDKRNVLDHDYTTPSNRVFSLTHQSLDMFEKLNLSKTSTDEIRYTDGIQVWNHNSGAFLRFDNHHRPVGWQHFGAIVNHNYLMSNLVKQVRDQNVDFFFTPDKIKYIDNFKQKGAEITFENGDQINTKLLVCAEAGQSDVSHLLGVGAKGVWHNQWAITCSVRSADIHQNLAFQKYFSEEVIGILPTGNDTWSIVWSVRRDYHDYLVDLSANDFLRELNSKIKADDQKSQGFVEPPFFTERLDKISAFPLTTKLLDSFVVNNVVFVGDSAHKIHPMLGQGLNLGLTDVSELTRQLFWMLDHCIDLKRSEYLADWSKNMHKNNLFFQSAVEFLKMSYYSSNPVISTARDATILAINSSDTLKKKLVSLAN